MLKIKFLCTGPRRGQEGGGEAACWSYSSGLQDQVSDLMDGGQEGGGQQPVGLTALDFRIRSVTSWTEDRKEEVNSQLVLQLWTSGSGL